tara:strand:- start:1484 stop:2260 length:777 start_codon:yes stop_codon:yes gene_type:complete
MDSIIKKFTSDDEAYYSDYSFVTNSQLGILNRSPATYQYYKDNPSHRPVTKALNFGRAFHMCMLEHDKFELDVVVEPDVNKRTKSGKEEYSKFLSLHDSKTILSRDEQDSLIGMRNRLTSSSEAMELLSGGLAEQVNIWNDPIHHVPCKGKADYYNKDKNILVDIKTTQDASPKGFRSSAYKYAYDRQSAFYLDGFEAEEFWFIVIEKSAPYNLGIYKCSLDFLDEGREKYSELLETYSYYFIQKLFKPYDHSFSGTL